MESKFNPFSAAKSVSAHQPFGSVSRYLLQSLCKSCEVMQKRIQGFCKHRKENLQIRIQGNCIPRFASDPVSLPCLVTDAQNHSRVGSLFPAGTTTALYVRSQPFARREQSGGSSIWGGSGCTLPVPSALAAALLVAQTQPAALHHALEENANCFLAPQRWCA